ncbi:MAG TPA: TylF/MycF/NovP-related O-methyltransferase [Edaphocola sp.]|nr:TylF/MycF/NovP-related O-methyltransferase [Edaphocola sp.]
MKKAIISGLNKLGYNLVKKGTKIEENYPDINEKEFWDLFHFCKPYTMTSVERLYGLYSAVNYVLSHNIQGNFIECGVWRGGSAMLIAKMLVNRNILDRKIFLYDTFEGMSAPTKNDVAIDGNDAHQLMEASLDNKEESVWCLADLTDVQRNLKSTKYPDNNLIFVKGKVEDTIPSTLPQGGHCPTPLRYRLV